ncbi:DNA cytosine methyltransferase [Bacillus velezensis]|nr:MULTISPECIES: DNA cytosine methyltransferase [Bacillus]MEC2214113.1 DNA cytosine methyltransferase [Bacillus velezensis]UJX16731.1 DNA cytosine methyltransferase [Bacillus sp. R45]WFR90469.1 DNA cytosine methyltransferase [Bacillus velezensis]
MKSIELFADIGGIALAAEWASVETVAFCEREPCQKVLNKNFPDVPIFSDVCTLNRQFLEEERRAKKQYVRLENTVSSLEGKRVGGQLNSTWVEWLVGFPTGWTELKD